jgi:hypothetical protein
MRFESVFTTVGSDACPSARFANEEVALRSSNVSLLPVTKSETGHGQAFAKRSGDVTDRDALKTIGGGAA